MHRFYLPPEECRGDPLVLSPREAHHALHVLRLHAGDRTVVLNGAGDELLCEVGSADRRGVTLHVLHRNHHPREPCQVTLIQAVTRGKSMDLIVQKATELGAHRIVPILSDRTVTRVDPEGAESRRARWEETAIEAIKQCGLAWLPEIAVPTATAAYIARNDRFELALVASLQGEARHPREYFEAFRTKHDRNPGTICVWVGPEGDFTPAEMNTIRASGAQPITLGNLVLRSETAAVYCLSVISYEIHPPKTSG